MRQCSTVFAVSTNGPGLTPVTDRINAWVAAQNPREGLLTLLCRHTSASLTIQENASPDVRDDLGAAFDRLAPRDVAYAHRLEGPDDMPAHIRTVLSGVHLSVPIANGRLLLGTWQGVYLWEHRDRPHQREIASHLLFE